MQQMGRPGGFFLLFGILRFLPYIAIGFLVIAISIWVVFGIKKFRWAKILAIVLTVFVIIFGSLSLLSIFLGRNMPGGRIGPQDGKFQQPDGQNFNNGQPQDGVQTNNEILIKI
jgi:energy-coupling factor transporter transmembrane protein EcfT